MQTNRYVPLVILIAVIAIAGFFFARSRSVLAPSPVGETATSTATTTDIGGVTTTEGSATVEVVGSTLPPPSLNKPISITAALPADAEKIVRSNLEILTSQLKQEPTRTDLWLTLGVNRKIAGDFQGAIEAWNYVAAVGSTSVNYVAYGDLGDMYMNFQKDYPKSEANYKKAIAIKPTVIGYYSDLYRLYHYLYKVGTGADAAILEQGLKANPNNPDLLQLQSQLKAGTNQ